MSPFAALCSATIVLALGTSAPHAQSRLGGPSNTPMDFNINVKRVLDARCVSCHGPDRQQGGLRLDNREAAMKGGAHGPVIVPGSSADSRLFQMVSSGRMPLDEPLSQFDLRALQTWLDQGALWPDRAARSFPVEPKVDAYGRAVRDADWRAAAALAKDPAVLAGRGEGGVTALHHAALFGRAAEVAALIAAGADVNKADAVGVTPLMWAMTDEAKARLLMARGADVNATADNGLSPLIVAASRTGGAPLVRELLRRGAVVRPAQIAVLAASVGVTDDLELLKTVYPSLLDPRGPVGGQAAADAANHRCWDCLDFILGLGVPTAELGPALVAAANSGDAAIVRRLIELGAPLTARGSQGSTALMAALTSPIEAAEKTRLLLDAGAELNARTPDGRTALWYARTRQPELVALLTAKGAQ